MAYRMLYARYDPDNYVGHRMEPLKATTLDEAHAEAKATLDKAWIKGPWEYWIIKVHAGPKLYPE